MNKTDIKMREIRMALEMQRRKQMTKIICGHCKATTYYHQVPYKCINCNGIIQPFSRDDDYTSPIIIDPIIDNSTDSDNLSDIGGGGDFGGSGSDGSW